MKAASFALAAVVVSELELPPQADATIASAAIEASKRDVRAMGSP
jgi:hypothetical protein